MKARLALMAAMTAALFWLAADPSSAQPPVKKAARKPTTAGKSDWPARKHEPREVADLIDKCVERRLAEAKIPASSPADDAEFLRRLSIDLRGRVPTAERVTAFLADGDPDKRRKLIDEFLNEPDYGEHFSIIWYHRMVQPTMDNQGLLAKTFQGWLADQFNANAGWDKTVKAILTASGERDKNPATVFWLNNVEGNNRREVAPNKVTAAASHLFLGLKLECCECHNHPFDEGLKQTDFWGMAAFFTTTHADKTGKANVQADEQPSIREQNGVVRSPARAKGKDRAAPAAPYGQIVIPDSKGKTVAARYPLSDTPRFTPGISLRTELADWLTAARNPFFARASVNKLWANFFGRGIVNPVEDMRPSAANSFPDLLEALAVEFASSGFDQKHLVRAICLSKTYQRTSQATAENKEDDELLSHMRLKVMTADVLYDSLAVVLDHPVAEGGGRDKSNPMKRNPGNARDQFRRFFHAEADDDAGVVEDYTHGVPQVLRLMNSQQMNNTNAVVKTLMKDAKPEQVIESMYLRVLGRPPTSAEIQRIGGYVATERDKTKAYGDAMWALLNSAEFMFNH